MGEVVAAIGMSHAPLILAESEEPPTQQVEHFNSAIAELREQLAEAEPDLIIAIIDDHFENFFMNHMPTFAVGLADENYGPPEHYVDWLGLDTREIASSRSYAEEILAGTIAQGFDLSGAGSPVALGHAVMVPMQLLRPEWDVPILPLFVNVFTPPLARPARAYELGEAIRDVVAQRPERVAVLATGALSHWPPFWKPESPTDDEFLERMRRFQTHGLAVLDEDPELYIDLGKRENEMVASDMRLINPEWDERILRAFSEGDVDFVTSLTFDEIEEQGGNGGHEVLNWIVMLGMCGGRPFRTLCYEPVREWMCGIGFVSYDASAVPAQ